MPDGYTVKNLSEVEDGAPGIGLGDYQQARFAQGDLGAEQTGFTHTRVNPSTRVPFAHLHRKAEEVYVVLSGSGRVKIDDDVVEIGVHDAIRIAPGVARGWESGPDGLEFLAFGPQVEGDAEVVENFWPQ